MHKAHTIIVVIIAMSISIHAAGQDRLESDARPQPDALDRLLRKLALDAMPDVYEDADDWDRTKEFTTGLHVSREGLKIETRRKRRYLNHGLWQRHRIWLRDAEQFTLDVRDVRAGENGRTALTIEATAPLRAHTRRSRWRRGVQLWSISADADVTMRVRLECTLAVRLDTTELPPAVVLLPEVRSAQIEMRRFQLIGVSKVRGEVADEIGDALREFIEKEVEAKDEKLVVKLNQRIAKSEDRLRLSLAALARSPLRVLADDVEP